MLQIFGFYYIIGPFLVSTFATGVHGFILGLASIGTFDFFNYVLFNSLVFTSPSATNLRGWFPFFGCIAALLGAWFGKYPLQGRALFNWHDPYSMLVIGFVTIVMLSPLLLYSWIHTQWGWFWAVSGWFLIFLVACGILFLVLYKFIESHKLLTKKSKDEHDDPYEIFDYIPHVFDSTQNLSAFIISLIMVVGAICLGQLSNLLAPTYIASSEIDLYSTGISLLVGGIASILIYFYHQWALNATLIHRHLAETHQK